MKREQREKRGEKNKREKSEILGVSVLWSCSVGQFLVSKERELQLLPVVNLWVN